ncbi:MAG: hydrolase [Motiliproteus sp.]|nr:hydrolase [Motiliproteus sp.]MCW9052967.1 hydrolase [Motiliproteus sp.]
MLINADQSCLLVVDIQGKLVPAVYDNETMVKHSKWLLEVAHILDIPVLTSEQYPQGLGPTIDELQHLLPKQGKMDKVHFSCAKDQGCLNAINSTDRQQVVIIGMEAHVCVMQTAFGLKDAGKEVYIVADAVGSRNPDDKALALTRMREYGIHIVSREMVAFEWMEKSGTDEFRKISMEYLR